ncbi:hypothetical protein CY34DRAFT_797485 [Suillus luteus UH-Slu-Lm8-n1]|uniref:Uncharacterized protein n=1 Tax=Suillus luteus UH-Slu-Lm8-n1 TaxID=930992 RepID=A0A0D0AFZ4_9AGAM|nr:hypothetical protein CY34DRAFT_797485 [Suillus luteus UH-Slu-Lm8-n1]
MLVPVVLPAYLPRYCHEFTHYAVPVTRQWAQCNDHLHENQVSSSLHISRHQSNANQAYICILLELSAAFRCQRTDIEGFARRLGRGHLW